MLKQFLFIIFVCTSLQKSDVYYIKKISSSNIVKIFKKLNITLTGNIGLKVHTGEIGGKFFLHPDFLQEIYDYLNGTFIECNTAYTTYSRHTTLLHEKVLMYNGWRNKSRRTVIMDEFPSDDFILPIPHHKNISHNIVGGHLKDFNSSLVLAHFKGHAMGGFGGALKQLSIGFASSAGKSNIHSGGYTDNYNETWNHKAIQKDFTEAMADAAWSIVNYFRDRGGIAFINVMSNISLYCDCGVGAPDPKIRDLGILASLDPVAIDRASFDLIEKENTDGSREWIDRANGLLGQHTLEVSEELGTGTQDYNLIYIDDDEDEKNYLLWLILILVIVIASVVIGLVIFCLWKRKTQSQISDGSLGVSMTGKKEV